MGNQKSKVDRADANVVNEIEVGTESVELSRIETYLIIIVIVLCLHFALHIYGMHSRKHKKRYLSRATDLDKV